MLTKLSLSICQQLDTQRIGELCDKSGMMNSIELIGGNYMAAKGGSLQWENPSKWAGELKDPSAQKPKSGHWISSWKWSVLLNFFDHGCYVESRGGGRFICWHWQKGAGRTQFVAYLQIAEQGKNRLHKKVSSLSFCSGLKEKPTPFWLQAKGKNLWVFLL